MIHHLQGREKALEPFGLTGRRAEWIALASLHGGVFTRTQCSAWLGVSRLAALRFVQALRDRRLAAEEPVGDLKVCRISARGIYRSLGAEGVRHRRITSPEVALRRLLLFDYVIEHTGLPWLPIVVLAHLVASLPFRHGNLRCPLGACATEARRMWWGVERVNCGLTETSPR